MDIVSHAYIEDLHAYALIKLLAKFLCALNSAAFSVWYGLFPHFNIMFILLIY
jgi:hypothetical protein